MMNAKERYLAVFKDEKRKKLDRVPTFVQYIREEFIALHQDKLINEFKGELLNNSYFDIPMILGFDSIFAPFPSSIKFRPIKIKTSDGKEIKIGLNGEPVKKKSTYYQGGYLHEAEILEEMENNLKIIDNSENIKKVLKYYEKISPKIFSILEVDGIFDKTWRSMGMGLFSKHFKKNSKFYRQVNKFYARILEIEVEGLLNTHSTKGLVLNILDDIAYKGNLMISPERWRKDYLNFYKKITSMIQDADMIPLMHSDGDVTELVQLLMEAGFRGLQGWEGGSNPFYINKKFPEFVVIGFGDVSYVLPYGTKLEIENHVKMLMDALKGNKHFIIGPSTVIFKEIPLENVKYFIAASKKYGRYEEES
ncbi:MAG: uroporphyrinogen decarboxylase family protein [Promethearchaeota archaeon]